MVTTLFVIQIGLHRDSARWGLKETDIQRRRVLFWDIFIGDNGRVLPGRHLAQTLLLFFHGRYNPMTPTSSCNALAFRFSAPVSACVCSRNIL
ncbi:hypothetical protein BC835DRAFT_1397322, partial [Cytidiella melzeri]